LLDGLYYANKKTYAPTHDKINKEEHQSMFPQLNNSSDWMTS
jgi:hypothetical protein